MLISRAVDSVKAWPQHRVILAMISITTVQSFQRLTALEIRKTAKRWDTYLHTGIITHIAPRVVDCVMA